MKEQIIEILTKLRTINSEIGSYKTHASIDNPFIVEVKLTNGRIKIPLELIQDINSGSISSEHAKSALNSFLKD